jgi:hypothetical protein
MRRASIKCESRLAFHLAAEVSISFPRQSLCVLLFLKVLLLICRIIFSVDARSLKSPGRREGGRGVEGKKRAHVSITCHVAGNKIHKKAAATSLKIAKICLKFSN